MQNNKGNTNNNIGSHYSTNTQMITSTNTPIYESKGLQIMLLLLFLVELHSRFIHPIQNTSGLFTLAVIYCLYKDGMLYGLFSAVLAVAYTLYFYATPNEILLYTHNSLLKVSLNIVALLGGIVVVSFQRKEIQTYLHKLQGSEKKFRNLFQNANDAIFLYKLIDNQRPGEYIEVNNTACSRLGYTREELLKMSPIDINLQNQQYQFNDVIKKLVNYGHSTIETTHITKAGTTIPVEVSSHLFTLDNESMVLAIARDLSERQATFQKLLESEERYRQLVENSPDGIVIHNSGRIIYANNAAARLVKINSPEALIGIDINDIIKGDVKCVNEKYIQQIIAMDGSTMDVEIICISLPFKGDVTHQVIIRDISDRMKAEELQENIEEKKKLLEDALKTDQIKTELFSSISHELRTPINVIFATLQLIEFFVNNQDHNNDSKNLNKYLHITKQNCYRLLRLVNNSIDISKIDSGFFQINLQNHNIISLVEDITLSVAEYIENKNIQLQFDTNIEELVIACDPDKIERIMLNLLSNATKFTKKDGSIFVNLNKENDKIYISVKDTGIGIPKEKLDLVFQRYRQANNPLVKNNQGSGIGLSLVKSLVEMHNGRVYVFSESNKGSEFIVELPAIASASEIPINLQTDMNEGRIERINIEFSDIYGTSI